MSIELKKAQFQRSENKGLLLLLLYPLHYRDNGTSFLSYSDPHSPKKIPHPERCHCLSICYCISTIETTEYALLCLQLKGIKLTGGVQRLLESLWVSAFHVQIRSPLTSENHYLMIVCWLATTTLHGFIYDVHT